MNKEDSYRPENIEKLLMSKSFDELLETEKSYVLQHVASKEEYEEMRLLLVGIEVAATDSKNQLAPPAELKNMLMQEFDKKVSKQKYWYFSLNQLFVSASNFFRQSFRQPVYKNPALQYALAVSIVLIGFFIMEHKITPVKNTELAMEKTQVQPQPKQPEQQVEKPQPIQPKPVKMKKNEEKENDEVFSLEDESELEKPSEIIAGDEMDVKLSDIDLVEEETENKALKEVVITEDEGFPEIAEINKQVTANDKYETKNAVVTNMKAPAMRTNAVVSKKKLYTAKPISEDKDLLRILFTTW